MPKRRRPRHSSNSTDESTSPPSSQSSLRIRRSASEGALQDISNSQHLHDVDTPSRPTRRQPVENLGPPRSDHQMTRLDMERGRLRLELIHHLNGNIFGLSRDSPSPQELQRLLASHGLATPQNTALRELRRARLRQLRGHRGHRGQRTRDFAANILTINNDARIVAEH